MERPLISILICRLVGRDESYNKLLSVLQPQIGTVAVIQELVDNGEMPIGEKRNTLLDMATGEYCCFIDDDDMVAENYVSAIANALSAKPDCAEIRGKIFWFNEWVEFRHSIRYCGWYTNDGIFFRTPNHLNAIRTEIACNTRFPDDSRGGEDAEYSKRIRKFLKTEGACPDILYMYVPHMTETRS